VLRGNPPHGVGHVVLVLDELAHRLVDLEIRPADVVHHRVRPDRGRGRNVLEEDEGKAVILEREFPSVVENSPTLTPPDEDTILEETIVAVSAREQPETMNRHSIFHVHVLIAHVRDAGVHQHTALHDAEVQIAVRYNSASRTAHCGFENVHIHHIGRNKVLNIRKVQRSLVWEQLEWRIDLVLALTKRIFLDLEVVELSAISHRPQFPLTLG
jgi:hypothetical protein